MIVQKSVGCRNVPVEIISGRNQLAGYLFAGNGLPLSVISTSASNGTSGKQN